MPRLDASDVAMYGRASDADLTGDRSRGFPFGQ